jgi:hypothetical protein
MLEPFFESTHTHRTLERLPSEPLNERTFDSKPNGEIIFGKRGTSILSILMRVQWRDQCASLFFWEYFKTSRGIYKYSHCTRSIQIHFYKVLSNTRVIVKISIITAIFLQFL